MLLLPFTSDEVCVKGRSLLVCKNRSSLNSFQVCLKCSGILHMLAAALKKHCYSMLLQLFPRSSIMSVVCLHKSVNGIKT